MEKYKFISIIFKSRHFSIINPFLPIRSESALRTHRWPLRLAFPPAFRRSVEVFDPRKLVNVFAARPLVPILKGSNPIHVNEGLHLKMAPM